MLTKIFSIAAVLLALQISIASAAKFNAPIVPVKVEIEKISEKKSQVTLEIKRSVKAVKSYSYRISRQLDAEILAAGFYDFGGKTSKIKFKYDDLAQVTPDSLTLELKFEFEDGYNFSKRPLLKTARYWIEFRRYKKDLAAQIYSLE